MILNPPAPTAFPGSRLGQGQERSLTPDTRGRLAPEGGHSSIKLCFGLNEEVVRLRAVKEPRRSRSFCFRVKAVKMLVGV